MDTEKEDNADDKQGHGEIPDLNMTLAYRQRWKNASGTAASPQFCNRKPQNKLSR
jgi:hypothetical protein